MKYIVLLFFGTLWISSSAQNLPLEQFLSHPVAANLAASPSGRLLAWSVNDRGKRNIFVANSEGTARVRQLTQYQEDDGQELSDLLFSHDEKYLIYVRGGSSNRYGQHPNPASLPEVVEQSIWLVAVDNPSTPRKLANGSNPVHYPTESKILITQAGKLFSIALSGDARPEPLFHTRGNVQDYSFSGSGKQLVFSSHRGDHSFIGVYDLQEKKIRWIAPEVSHDILPVWSPDDKQIAFIRQPGLKAGELPNLTGGVPFSVWVADVAGGRAAAVWRSPSDDGGFAQSYPSPPLAWARSGRILFFSEHEGWNHVYSMNADGRDLRDITPGDGLVESYSLAENGSVIYFDGNRNDINRRHIWKSHVTSGKPQAVTQGEGIEMYPQVINGQLYCMRSQYDASLSLTKYVPEQNQFIGFLSPTSTPFTKAGFVKPEPVIFKAADGTTIHGQLFINWSVKEKRPALVFMHGGPIRQMLLGFHYSEYYIHAYAFNQFMASKGYVVLSVNYRDGIGYGRDFRRAKNQGPRGASEYQDIVAAGKYLQALREVDPGSIGLWGGSYGGYLTAMGLARNPELFKAGVDLHGVHDWAFRAREFTPGGWWGIGPDDMATAYSSSPVSDLSRWTAPVLLVHGDDDRNVLFQQTVDLAERLRERKVPVEILVLPDEVHGFLRYESWLRTFTAAHDFFERQLK